MKATGGMLGRRVVGRGAVQGPAALPPIIYPNGINTVTGHHNYPFMNESASEVYRNSALLAIQTGTPAHPVEPTILDGRDAHQSGFACVSGQLNVAAAPYINACRPIDGRPMRVEVNSGLFADAAARTTGKEHWVELNKFCSALHPDIHKQVLFRALVGGFGYAPVPTDITREIVDKHIDNGVDTFRIFDAFNSLDNMAPAIDRVLEQGKTVFVAYCFTKIPNVPLQAERYRKFVSDVRKRYGDLVQVDMKDMSAGMEVRDTNSLMSVHDDKVGKHSHSEQGFTDESNLAFVATGGRRLDLVSEAFGTHGGFYKTAKMLHGTPYDLRIPFGAISELNNFWERELPLFEPFKTKYPANIKQAARASQLPGGSFGSTSARLNDIKQAGKMGDVLYNAGAVRNQLNSLPAVTPSALIITNQGFQIAVNKNERPLKQTQDIVAGIFGEWEGIDSDYQRFCMVSRIEDRYAALAKEELNKETLKTIANEIYTFAEERIVPWSEEAKKAGESLDPLVQILKGKPSKEQISRLCEACPTLASAVEQNLITKDAAASLLAAGTRNIVIPPAELLAPGLEKAGEELLAFAKKEGITIRNFENDRASWAALQTGNPLDNPYQDFLRKREKNDPLLFKGSTESLEKHRAEQAGKSVTSSKKEIPVAFPHDTAPYMRPPVEWTESNISPIIEKLQLANTSANSINEIARQLLMQQIVMAGYKDGTLEALHARHDGLLALKKYFPSIEPTAEEVNAVKINRQLGFVREEVGNSLIARIGQLEGQRFFQQHNPNFTHPAYAKDVHEDLNYFWGQAQAVLEKAMESQKYASVGEQGVTAGMDPQEVFSELVNQAKSEFISTLRTEQQRQAAELQKVIGDTQPILPEEAIAACEVIGVRHHNNTAVVASVVNNATAGQQPASSSIDGTPLDSGEFVVEGTATVSGSGGLKATEVRCAAVPERRGVTWVEAAAAGSGEKSSLAGNKWRDRVAKEEGIQREV